jgi:hemerythrin
MPLFEWGSQYSVGIEQMDKQHLRLVELINDVYDHRNHHEREHLSKIILSLLQYIEIHFAAEEKLMKNFDYPELEVHRQEHQLLIKKVHGFKDVILNEESNLSVNGNKLGLFLCSWLSDHVLSKDKKYATFIHK